MKKRKVKKADARDRVSSNLKRLREFGCEPKQMTIFAEDFDALEGKFFGIELIRGSARL